MDELGVLERGGDFVGTSNFYYDFVYNLPILIRRQGILRGISVGLGTEFTLCLLRSYRRMCKVC